MKQNITSMVVGGSYFSIAAYVSEGDVPLKGTWFIGTVACKLPLF
jgi:hypothetical protein